MAVRSVAQLHTRPSLHAGVLPPVVLAAAMLPAALDLLILVQPALAGVLAETTSIAALIAAGALVATWVRFPRTTWLLAAAFAACASVAMRLVGSEAAVMLSVLSITALGVGGAFGSAEISPTQADV